MPDSSTYPFYQAYVKNVKDFLEAEVEVRRTINRAYKTGKYHTAAIHTKLYALLYSTFSEANFMKLILTPYGFEQVFVDQILLESSVLEKWQKCLGLAFLKFTKSSKGSDKHNKLQELKRIIQTFIVDPSIIRNKIAHGQLTIAMNNTNTALNVDLTNKLAAMDYVWVYRLFEVNKKLTQIVEDLIESPDKAHFMRYHAKYQELEAFIRKTQAWDVSSKMTTRSMKKPVNYFEKGGNNYIDPR